MVELIKQREQHPHLPFIPIWNCLGRCWHLWRWLIHPVWPERSGEESGAGSSPGLQLPAALPWHHHSVTSLVMELPAPHPHTRTETPISCLQASCCNQQRPWLDLGRWAQYTLITGARTCQIIPSVSVCDCVVAERERGRGRMICAVQPYYKLQINIFSHLPGCNHADSLGFYMLGLHFVFHTNTTENTTEVALRNNSLSCWDCVPQHVNMLTMKSDVYHVHHLSSLCYPANIWWLALKTKYGCCKSFEFLLRATWICAAIHPMVLSLDQSGGLTDHKQYLR